MHSDIATHLGAVTREVHTREHNNAPARVVVARRRYNTDRSDVWDALTSAERIPRWFLPVTGELKLGGRYQLQGNAGGEITVCEPPEKLALTWEFGGNTSWVTVNLTEISLGITQLELEHIAHVPDELWDQFGPGAVGVGWDLTLMGLARHLPTGASKTPQEAMQWMGSEEGKAFMRGSSADWRRASIVSGTAEDKANAAASRTTAAYTSQPDLDASGNKKPSDHHSSR